MTLRNRVNPTLQERVDRLRLPLAPLLRMPFGPIHPEFPKTLLAYNLLTEEQLDKLAHHYHQSTPDVWTHHYPITVLWPRRLSTSASTLPSPLPSGAQLARRSSAPVVSSNDRLTITARRPSTDDNTNQGTSESQDDPLAVVLQNTDAAQRQRREQRRWSAILRHDGDRISVKRRKFGKFIGLAGMDTPSPEVAARMQHELERRVRALRRERRRLEDRELAAGKWR